MMTTLPSNTLRLKQFFADSVSGSYRALRRLGFVDGEILDALAHGLNIVAVSSQLKAFARP
jgi:hypothetical protein